jgi:hypothetical protein
MPARLPATIACHREASPLSRLWAKVSLHSAFLPILTPLPLVTPTWYPVPFSFGSDKMGQVGKRVMLFSVLGAYSCEPIVHREPGAEARHRFRITASFCAAAHILEPGAAGWLNVRGRRRSSAEHKSDSRPG